MRYVPMGSICKVCTCLSINQSTEHPTISQDGTTCIYCGYYVKDRVMSKPLLKMQKKILSMPIEKRADREVLAFKDKWEIDHEGEENE